MRIIFKQIYLTHTGTTTPGQNKLRSNGNEELIQHSPDLLNISNSLLKYILWYLSTSRHYDYVLGSWHWPRQSYMKAGLLTDAVQEKYKVPYYLASVSKELPQQKAPKSWDPRIRRMHPFQRSKTTPLVT